MNKYAASLADNVVVQVIVGDPAWATENLGGEWVGSDEKVGIGWVWDGHQFNPPPEPELSA